MVILASVHRDPDMVLATGTVIRNTPSAWIQPRSPTTGRTGLSLNLTLAIYSKSPGAYVEVFYRGGFLVAASCDAAQMPERCAKPQKVVELPVVARASMLPVGNVLDTLAKEIEQGAAVFDLRLNIPYYKRSGRPGLSMHNCKGSRIGRGLKLKVGMDCRASTALIGLICRA